jgi:hypothetical protein
MTGVMEHVPDGVAGSRTSLLKFLLMVSTLLQTVGRRLPASSHSPKERISLMQWTGCTK